MDKRKKHKILNIVFYFFIFTMLFYIVVNSFFPEQSIHIMGFKSYVVVSDSMEPDIMINDLVIVTKIKEEDLQVDQAISFYTYLPTNQRDDYGNTIYLKSVVTHYLADIIETDEGKIYKTHRAGTDNFDNWNDIDGEPTDITYQDIIGNVSSVVPNVGVVLRVFTNPIMVILIGANIAIIVTVVKVTRKALKQGENK